MAEHTQDEWHAIGRKSGWFKVLENSEGASLIITKNLSERRARQIVREHNMHGRLVEACKAALAQSLLTMSDGSGRKSCHHCAHIGEHDPTCIFAGLARVIAEAGKRNET